MLSRTEKKNTRETLTREGFLKSEVNGFIRGDLDINSDTTKRLRRSRLKWRSGLLLKGWDSEQINNTVRGWYRQKDSMSPWDLFRDEYALSKPKPKMTGAELVVTVSQVKKRKVEVAALAARSKVKKLYGRRPIVRRRGMLRIKKVQNG